jgi:hypothetical protein
VGRHRRRGAAPGRFGLPDRWRTDVPTPHGPGDRFPATRRRSPLLAGIVPGRVRFRPADRRDALRSHTLRITSGERGRDRLVHRTEPGTAVVGRRRARTVRQLTHDDATRGLRPTAVPAPGGPGAAVPEPSYRPGPSRHAPRRATTAAARDAYRGGRQEPALLVAGGRARLVATFFRAPARRTHSARSVPSARRTAPAAAPPDRLRTSPGDRPAFLRSVARLVDPTGDSRGAPA